MVNTYKALGLEVTTSEMDVHTLNTTLQTDIYNAVVGKALNAGIADVGFWGFTDNPDYTWIKGAKSLMFDEYYNPKDAFYATRTALTTIAYGLCRAARDCALHDSCRALESFRILIQIMSKKEGCDLLSTLT